MDVKITIITTTRHRTLVDGTPRAHRQFYVNFRDPQTGQRIRRAKPTRKEAEAYRADLLRRFAEGNFIDERKAPTVAAAVDHWLGTKRGNVKPSTLKGYRVVALAEEDFGIRAPSMPTGLARAKSRPKKSILSTEDIARLIAGARDDADHGIYYAFPFLAGTRPSEQLGLLWSEVDFDRNVIRICRIQERDGSLTEMTKTEAGTREIPIGATLREMLLLWRLRCPRKGKELHRVFPGPGRLQPWPKPRLGGGGALLYQNFRRRIWEPAFERLGLDYVTPHSARHSFISTLQAEGIEVGLVARIAGHANPTVTLGHYTQAVRGGEAAVAALDRAFGFA